MSLLLPRGGAATLKEVGAGDFERHRVNVQAEDSGGSPLKQRDAMPTRAQRAVNDALQRANKDFELMFYPQARHGIGGAHYLKLQLESIRRTMLKP